jgi:hypothetical protein
MRDYADLLGGRLVYENPARVISKYCPAGWKKKQGPRGKKEAAKNCTSAISERENCMAAAAAAAAANAPAKRIKNPAQYMCTTCDHSYFCV